jgi:exopolyphosphatase/guanosine-5'-triphosphate,3'-diphosphate pyrophosphatase
VEDTLASIEIGTNSIRMLIARIHGRGGGLRQVMRKRILTRLGEGFGTQHSGALTQEAMAKSIEVLKDFVSLASEYGASSPFMVATGVVRRASNREAFLDLAAENLRTPITIISGQREADLTWKGVTTGLDRGGEADVIFDLGGGSTEFIFSHAKQTKVLSVDIGAVTLTDEYLTSDPPTDGEIYSLTSCIDRELKQCLDPWKATIRGGPFIVGTGGTVITLAAMLYHIGVDEFSEAMNGLVIQGNALQSCIAAMKTMSSTHRVKLTGLEPGREDIILAGTLVVAKIMEYFEAHEITVSYSDILEGILVDYIEGVTNGQPTNKRGPYL